MQKEHIHLSEVDRTYLEELLSQGELPVKVYRRALGLLELDRRIPTFEPLEAEILAFFDDRQRRNIKITWQFSIPTARHKLNTHYTAVQPDNAKFKSS